MVAKTLLSRHFDDQSSDRSTRDTTSCPGKFRRKERGDDPTILSRIDASVTRRYREEEDLHDDDDDSRDVLTYDSAPSLRSNSRRADYSRRSVYTSNTASADHRTRSTTSSISSSVLSASESGRRSTHSHSSRSSRSSGSSRLGSLKAYGSLSALPSIEEEKEFIDYCAREDARSEPAPRTKSRKKKTMAVKQQKGKLVDSDMYEGVEEEQDEEQEEQEQTSTSNVPRPGSAVVTKSRVLQIKSRPKSVPAQLPGGAGNAFWSRLAAKGRNKKNKQPIAPSPTPQAAFAQQIVDTAGISRPDRTVMSRESSNDKNNTKGFQNPCATSLQDVYDDAPVTTPPPRGLLSSTHQKSPIITLSPTSRKHKMPQMACGIHLEDDDDDDDDDDGQGLDMVTLSNSSDEYCADDDTVEMQGFGCHFPPHGCTAVVRKESYSFEEANTLHKRVQRADDNISNVGHNDDDEQEDGMTVSTDSSSIHRHRRRRKKERSLKLYDFISRHLSISRRHKKKQPQVYLVPGDDYERIEAQIERGGRVVCDLPRKQKTRRQDSPPLVEGEKVEVSTVRVPDKEREPAATVPDDGCLVTPVHSNHTQRNMSPIKQHSLEKSEIPHTTKPDRRRGSSPLHVAPKRNFRRFIPAESPNSILASQSTHTGSISRADPTSTILQTIPWDEVMLCGEFLSFQDCPKSLRDAL